MHACNETEIKVTCKQVARHIKTRLKKLNAVFSYLKDLNIQPNAL